MPRRTSPRRARPPARRLRKNGHATGSRYSYPVYVRYSSKNYGFVVVAARSKAYWILSCAYNNQFRLPTDPTYTGLGPLPTWAWKRIRAGDDYHFVKRKKIAGFSLVHGNVTMLEIPHWFVVLTLGVPLALWVRRYRQYRVLDSCLRCGYDLRASKDKCPECGMPIGASHNKCQKLTGQAPGL